MSQLPLACFPIREPTVADTIFCTGFPGFLGSALVGRLLDRHDRAVTLTALVQPRYRQQAEARAARIEAESPQRHGRIRIVEGDIARPGLGMDTAAYRAVQRDAREIWHLAAVYDLGVGKDLAERVNVQGTRNVLDLATGAPGLKRFQYMSTCYVSGRYPGIFRETDLHGSGPFNNHYEETKHRAEVEVQRAMSRGLPATVYRPAIVVGDSRTGETQKYDGPYYIIQWILRWSRVAPLPLPGDPTRYRVNVVPRDFVVDALDHLSSLDASKGKVYHLTDSQSLTVDDMIRILSTITDRRLLRVRVPARVALAAFRHVPGVASLTGIEPEAVPYFSHPTHYDTAQADRDLDGSGISCPPFQRYAERLVRFMEENPDITSAGMA
jgi:thioester reductase-like protein